MKLQNTNRPRSIWKYLGIALLFVPACENTESPKEVDYFYNDESSSIAAPTCRIADNDPDQNISLNLKLELEAGKVVQIPNFSNHLVARPNAAARFAKIPGIMELEFDKVVSHYDSDSGTFSLIVPARDILENRLTLKTADSECSIAAPIRIRGSIDD